MINILVVEDDIRLNKIVCDYLFGSGYSVKGCLNANDAYDAMYSKPMRCWPDHNKEGKL